jgi:hypothetical protein
LREGSSWLLALGSWLLALFVELSAEELDLSTKEALRHGGKQILDVLWLIIVVVFLWVVFRFVRSQFSPREPAEADQDPFAGVRSPNKRGPRGRSGAVALAEPDDGEEDQSFPPRIQ